MVATQKQRRVICTVVRIASSNDDARRPRPSDMLPWADPYIAGLVNRLQREVRFERSIVAQSPNSSAQLSGPNESRQTIATQRDRRGASTTWKLDGIHPQSQRDDRPIDSGD